MGNPHRCVHWSLASALSAKFMGEPFSVFAFHFNHTLLSVPIVGNEAAKRCTSHESIYNSPGYFPSNISTLKEHRRGKDLVFIRVFIPCICSVCGLCLGLGRRETQKRLRFSQPNRKWDTGSDKCPWRDARAYSSTTERLPRQFWAASWWWCLCPPDTPNTVKKGPFRVLSDAFHSA